MFTLSMDIVKFCVDKYKMDYLCWNKKEGAMILLLNLFYVLYAVMDGVHDGMVVKGYDRGWHILDAVIKGMVLIMVVMCVSGELYIDFGLLGPAWWEIMLLIGGGVAWRFLLFNFAYNAYVGNRWSYLGDNGIDKYVRGAWRTMAMMGAIFFILVEVIYFW